MVVEHVLNCRRETTLNSIALLSTSGCIFKYRRFLTLGRKMLECKSEHQVSRETEEIRDGNFSIID
jgi:hypothetical protein